MRSRIFTTLAVLTAILPIATVTQAAPGMHLFGKKTMSSPSTQTAMSGEFIGNKNSKVYHMPGDKGSLPAEKNRVYFKSEAAAIAAGYHKSGSKVGGSSHGMTSAHHSMPMAGHPMAAPGHTMPMLGHTMPAPGHPTPGTTHTMAPATHKFSLFGHKTPTTAKPATTPAHHFSLFKHPVKPGAKPATTGAPLNK